MYVVHNDFYGNASQPAPLDLPQLRAWVDHLAVDYAALMAAVPRRKRAAHEHRLGDLRAALGDADPRPGREAVRDLVVTGLVQYLAITRCTTPVPLSERVALDVVVFALWPVVQAPALPDDWEYDLAELASPRLASLVVQARRGLAAGHAVTSARFTRAIAAKPLSQGVLALFEDVADPRRGGAAITALALATGFPAPPTRRKPKEVFGWLVACVAVTGTPDGFPLVEFTDRLWKWLHGGGATFTGGGFDLVGTGVAGGHEARSGEPGAGSDLLDEMADGLFD
ncbi:hypothetical protein [Saccharothrix sp. Mg75]|uniref:hypothetical protein n=1 Tax=Saccharothrix sp. Mg75 TaxID=3445357 RepID=UPI003EEA7D8B